MIVLVAAVAHEDAFTVDDFVGAGIGIVMGEAGVVGYLMLPTDGQVAGGVLVTEEETGRGGAALFAGVPGLKDALDFVLPLGDVDTSTGGDDDNGLFAEGGDLLDKLLLADRKLKAAVAAFGLG